MMQQVEGSLLARRPILRHGISLIARHSPLCLHSQPSLLTHHKNAFFFIRIPPPALPYPPFPTPFPPSITCPPVCTWDIFPETPLTVMSKAFSKTTAAFVRLPSRTALVSSSSATLKMPMMLFMTSTARTSWARGKNINSR